MIIPHVSIRWLLRQRHIPRSSRARSPEGPASARESPQRHSRKTLLTGGIPAYPRSGRKRQDRPVTPEVAGSSPVASVFLKCLQTGNLLASLCRAARTEMDNRERHDLEDGFEAGKTPAIKSRDRRSHPSGGERDDKP